jgi:F-type H+-transporting ATPase subunit gamma
MLFEPNAEVVLDKLYEQISQALFLQALYELKASEYSSRMIAMKNATESADKIIKNLTLDLNKARQAAITQEIAELAGAQAAME